MFVPRSKSDKTYLASACASFVFIQTVMFSFTFFNRAGSYHEDFSFITAGSSVVESADFGRFSSDG